MIEVKHVFKSFETKDVLKDINAVFESGKTNLVIGQSGSGKNGIGKVYRWAGYSGAGRDSL